MDYNNNSGNVPGKGAATASLVLGIVSMVCLFGGYSSLVSIVCSIIGLIMATNAKKAGFVGGIRTAGFVLSLIGVIAGALVFISCVACVGALSAAGLFSEWYY